MPKVPGSPPHLREQDPQVLASARVIVWSQCSPPCPQKARRWEDRLARLNLGPVATLTCPHVLQKTFVINQGNRPADQVPLVLIDCPEPSPAVQRLERGTSPLPEEVWKVLASNPKVAVVPDLTWKDAGTWLLCGARSIIAWRSTDDEVQAALEAARAASLPQLHDLLQKMLGGSNGSGLRCPPADLSPREREVLLLVCEGMGNSEIASRMFVTQDDVRHHLKRLYRKMGTNNRVRVVLIALSRGWVTLQDLSQTPATATAQPSKTTCNGRLGQGNTGGT